MSLDASKANLIGIDWGTTSLRAYLIGAQGAVLDSLHSTEGIMQIQNNQFENTLHRLLEPWLKVEKLPVIASGMITSRNGWIETPYVPAPASASDLASELITVKTSDELDVHFITGVTTSSNGAPDVMRGEETQIVGAVQTGLINSEFVLPGTHSKWVTVREGCIETFATYISGEIFAALQEHTILGKLMKVGDFNEAGFTQGVADGYSAGSQLLHRLFHVRTLPLFDMLGEEQVSDYMSGMLIGAEIHGAIANGAGVQRITIIGKHALADRYAIALKFLDRNITIADNDIVARGHYAIAESSKLI